MRIPIIILTILMVFSSCKTENNLIKKYIVYDPKTKTIRAPHDADLSLPKKGSYQFLLTGLNNAYYTINYHVEKTKKDIELPTTLNFIPNGGQGLHIEETLKYINPGKINQFDAQLNDEFDTLQSYYNTGKKLEDTLKNNKNNIDSCISKAKEGIKEIAGTLGITDSSKDPELGLITDSLILDFESRVQLMKDNHAIKNNSTGLSIYKEWSLIENNKYYMKKIPSILEAYKNCTDTIPSLSYPIGKADFMDLTATIYGDKFDDSPDSILSFGFTYYRTKCFRFDISSGFFYNNLFSQSYYFADSVHIKQESKSKDDISVGALIHFNFIFTPWLKAGPCVGAGVSLLDEKTKIFAGPSIIFGRKTEIALSGGWAFANLPLPSNAVNGSYKGSPESSVPTYNSWTKGFFVGISYSFIKQ